MQADKKWSKRPRGGEEGAAKLRSRSPSVKEACLSRALAQLRLARTNESKSKSKSISQFSSPKPPIYIYIYWAVAF